MGAGRFDLWKSGQVEDLRSMVWMKPNQIWGPAPAIRSLKDLQENKISLHVEKPFLNIENKPIELKPAVSKELGALTTQNKPVLYLPKWEPYEDAKNGGKNSGYYQYLLNRPIQSLEKALTKMQKNITEHYEKISRLEERASKPNAYIVNISSYYGTLRSWHREILLYKQQLGIIEGIIKARKGG